MGEGVDIADEFGAGYAQEGVPDSIGRVVGVSDC